MYVVAGVSGNTGKVVAETLLESGAAVQARRERSEPSRTGNEVRVIVRDAGKGEAWRARGADVAIADVEDAEALAAALRGAEGAYLLLPPNFASTDNVRDNAARTRVIGEALAAAGTPHVVFLSSVGAQHADGTGPIKTLHRAEQELPKLAPKTRFTWLRAAYFIENVGSVVGVARDQGVLPSMIDPKKRIPMVATPDIGRTAALLLREGPTEGRANIVELAGPRDASFEDLATDLGALLGKTVAAVHVPRAGVKPALLQAGLPADLAGLYDEMLAGIDSGLVDFEANGARFVRGAVDPRDVLQQLAGGG